MNFISRLVLTMALIFSAVPLLAAESDSLAVDKGETRRLNREEMHIRFVVAKADINKDYMGNEAVLERIVEWAENIQKDSTVNIVSVEFCGAVSPEGSVQFNHWLSVARMTALEKYVRSRVDIPEEIITRSDHYIAWDELKDMVLASDLPNKDDIMQILNSENTSTGNALDSRIGALKAMDGGKTWRIIFNRYFIHMRNAYMVIVTEKNERYYAQKLKIEKVQQSAAIPYTATTDIKKEPFGRSYVPTPPPVEVPDMYVKTNAVGLALLSANAGVEFELGRYMSVNVPVYYSAVDYFSPTVKFRNLSTQPELRVWPMTNKKGLYVGAHMGVGYYNFAFNGKNRYQDFEGKTPAIGGGLSLGYRLPISKDKRWNVEFALGAGVYPIHYDVFQNVDDVRDGQLQEARKGTYIGLDNVMVGVSYRIPMKKAGN